MVIWYLVAQLGRELYKEIVGENSLVLQPLHSFSKIFHEIVNQRFWFRQMFLKAMTEAMTEGKIRGRDNKHSLIRKR